MKEKRAWSHAIARGAVILDSFKRTGVATYLYPTLATRFAFVKNYRERDSC